MVTSDIPPRENTPKSAHLHNLSLTIVIKQGEELSVSFMFTFRYFGIFPIGNLLNFCKNRNSDLLPGHCKLASLSLIQEDLTAEATDNKLKIKYN